MKSVNQKRKILSVLKEFTTRIFFLLAFPLLILDPITAQPDTIKVPSDLFTGEGNLNYAVKAVTDAGQLSNTIFMLEPYGRYVLTDSILVPAGEHLTIIAPEPGLTQWAAPPQILCSAKNNVFNLQLRFMFVCEGDLTLKNIWLLHANASGWQIQACTIFRDNPENVQIHKCDFDGVIIDYSSVPALAGGSITVACKNFKGTFKNSYWKNCTDAHFRYYGRAVSFPFNSVGYHIDSLSFENCTFANIGYVLMQEKGEYADYVKFNHCTFLNVVMYSLQSGWWHNLSLTNSNFTNTFMYGYIPKYIPFDGNEPNGGTIRIDSISTFEFDVPFTENERHILFANNSYFIENWLRDWMSNNPYSKSLIENGLVNEVPVPQPMLNAGTIEFFDSFENGKKLFPFMNRSDLYDSTEPGFILPPTDTSSAKNFLFHKWFDSADTNWAWKRQNSFNQLWPLEEKLSYTNNILLNAGLGGFPLGDLYRWFPDKYQQWETQKESEDVRISTWLKYGADPGTVNVVQQSISSLPLNYVLRQNYPNPFNPGTKIKYYVPRHSRISLKVYDVLGTEIETLFEGTQQTGSYVVSFDGSGLSSGVYFYQLKSDDFVDTKKFVLLK